MSGQLLERVGEEKNSGNIYKMSCFFAWIKSEIKASKLFTKEAIKLYQEIFAWAGGRLIELMHCSDNSRMIVPYPCHYVLKFANCHCCCFEITWSWNSRRLLHCPFVLLHKIVFQINHVTKCLCRCKGLKSDTMELLVWWEMAFSFRLSNFQLLTHLVSKQIAAKSLYSRI